MTKPAVRTALLLSAAAVGALGAAALQHHRAVSPATAASAPARDPPEPQVSRDRLLAAPTGTQADAVSVAPVTRTRLAPDLQVVGTVSYDQDRHAVVGPLVAGRVVRLAAGVGDPVRKGQVLAEIESAEVGQARGELIAHRARLEAAEANMARERELAEKHVSSAREYEMARAHWATERAGVHSATERLRAIGLSTSDIAAMVDHDCGGRVPIRAPIAGAVIERLVTLGQAVEHASDAFTIADLHQLWVQLDVYEKDLSRVHVGQPVEVRAEAFPRNVFRARVAYISPIVDPATRTAKVRVEVANPESKLRIGQLITARLSGDPANADEVVAVPRSAVQRVDGKPVVFVRTGARFSSRRIETGATAGDLTEVKQGLRVGEQVASDGAFLLKSELLR